VSATDGTRGEPPVIHGVGPVPVPVPKGSCLPYAARTTAELVADLVDRVVNAPTSLIYELGHRSERGDFDGPARVPDGDGGTT
jgi:hypothetical protein